MDKLILGLEVTLIGLVIVFIMLVLIIGVVKLIAAAGMAVDKLSKNMSAKKEEKPVKEEQVNEQEVTVPAASEDDLELIAVIAAACAAAMGTEPKNIAVRSVKKARRTAWANAGRRSQMM
mgnify:CR=1 FL=1